ncbi:MAG: hypothetical protein ACR2PS_08550 [Pseudomonadales bacterium]
MSIGKGYYAAVFMIANFSTAVLAQHDFFQNGEAGFVVSHIEYALGEDAENSGACPEGMTVGYSDPGAAFHNLPALRRQESEAEDKHVRRVFRAAFSGEETKNYCLNPELGSSRSTFRTVSGKNLAAEGIDLDGVHSESEDKPTTGTCRHDDFLGEDGQRGVDNQFFRVVGCSKSFQSTGLSNTYSIEMLTGAWGILIALNGVDDLHNDDYVEVGIHANADPIRLSPNREALQYATYAIDQDPRFRATTVGRIKDGVLTTDPVDVRFHKITNGMGMERPLIDASLHVSVSQEGILEGYLAGFTPVEDMYDLQYGFRKGMQGGDLAPLRLRAGSAIGQAHVLGHTCDGAYYALYQHADGSFDSEMGQCTSISTQYRIKAIPAFVVDVPTASVNEDLVGG